MTITFFIRKNEHQIETDHISLTNALQILGLHPETYLAMRNGKMITEDTILNDGDSVTLIAAISGGQQNRPAQL